jgi:hypothetical protein
VDPDSKKWLPRIGEKIKNLALGALDDLSGGLEASSRA